MKAGSRLCTATAVALALWFASESVVEAQKPIRIGVSASKTGTYAALGQNQLRGYELCVKHTNGRVASWGGGSSWSWTTTGPSLPPPSGSTNGSSPRKGSTSFSARTAHR